MLQETLYSTIEVYDRYLAVSLNLVILKSEINFGVCVRIKSGGIHWNKWKTKLFNILRNYELQLIVWSIFNPNKLENNKTFYT